MLLRLLPADPPVGSPAHFARALVVRRPRAAATALVLALLGGGGGALAAALRAWRPPPTAKAASNGKPRRPRRPPPPGRGLGRSLAASLLRAEPGRLSLLLLLAAARTALSHRQARLQGELFRAAFLRQPRRFGRLWIDNAICCLATAGLEAAADRGRAGLELAWRSRLSDGLRASYFDRMAYYKLHASGRSVPRSSIHPSIHPSFHQCHFPSLPPAATLLLDSSTQ